MNVIKKFIGVIVGVTLSLSGALAFAPQAQAAAKKAEVSSISIMSPLFEGPSSPFSDHSTIYVKVKLKSNLSTEKPTKATAVIVDNREPNLIKKKRLNSKVKLKYSQTYSSVFEDGYAVLAFITNKQLVPQSDLTFNLTGISGAGIKSNSKSKILASVPLIVEPPMLPKQDLATKTILFTLDATTPNSLRTRINDSNEIYNSYVRLAKEATDNCKENCTSLTRVLVQHAKDSKMAVAIVNAAFSAGISEEAKLSVLDAARKAAWTPTALRAIDSWYLKSVPALTSKKVAKDTSKLVKAKRTGNFALNQTVKRGKKSTIRFTKNVSNGQVVQVVTYNSKGKQVSVSKRIIVKNQRLQVSISKKTAKGKYAFAIYDTKTKSLINAKKFTVK